MSLRFALSAGDPFENQIDNRRRKPHGRLVEQQEFWRRHQTTSDRQHLLLATGQSACRLLQPIPQNGKNVEDIFDVAVARGPRLERGGAEPQVLANRQPPEYLAILWNMSYAQMRPLGRADASQILPLE